MFLTIIANRFFKDVKILKKQPAGTDTVVQGFKVQGYGVYPGTKS
jgi:hypothetical protein